MYRGFDDKEIEMTVGKQLDIDADQLEVLLSMLKNVKSMILSLINIL